MAHSSAYSAIEIDDDDLTNATELQFQNFSSSDTRANAPSGSISPAPDTQPPRPAGFGSSGIFTQSNANQEQNANKSIWSIGYYAKFFDVDTSQVLERCFASVIPKDNFLEVMGGNPDLYGPFWIATTVIFVLFVTSSIVDSINAYINKTPYTYDIFHMTFAFGTIYTYAFLVPLMVWGATKYFGCQPDLLEMLALYGYALTIWIPVSILSVIPIELARWILLGIGAGLSGVFLIRNMYPVLSRAEAQIAKIILILVIVFHGVLALLLKIRFFAFNNVGNPSAPEPPAPSPST
ncbi:Yip1 domain family [Mortierella sp. GBAus27b]|nr:Yip1 domain family [Mortierella sp. GBAus27b]